MFDFFVMKYFVALALLIGWTCFKKIFIAIFGNFPSNTASMCAIFFHDFKVFVV